MNEQERVHCSKLIKQVFTVQIDQVSSYIDYLTDIKAAISKNDTDTLNELLKKQQVSPALIEKYQTQQLKILNQYGFETNEEGLQACILECANSNQLQSLKERLRDKLSTLEKALMVNSLLVKKNQQRIKQSIRILSGHSGSTNNTSIYSKHGSIETHEDSKHSLAQA